MVSIMNQRSTMWSETKKKSDGTTSSKGYVFTPKIQFAGGEIKWYEDICKSAKKTKNLELKNF